jgi:hypothetical protein
MALPEEWLNVTSVAFSGTETASGPLPCLTDPALTQIARMTWPSGAV